MTACISVVIGVVNQIVSRRRTEKTEQLSLETRQAQLFMQIYNRWSDPQFAEQYGLARYKYGGQDPEKLLLASMGSGEQYDAEIFVAYHSLFQFFEGVSVLVHKRLIDLDLVDDLLSQRIVWFWEQLGPFITNRRTFHKDPTRYMNIEQLYHVMKHRQRPAAAST